MNQEECNIRSLHDEKSITYSIELDVA